MNKDNIKTILTFVLITTISTMFVSFVYFLTSPIIENNNLQRENQIISSMFPGAMIEDIDDNLILEEEKNQIINVLKVDNNYIYKAKSSDLFSGDETSFLIIINNDVFTDFEIIESEDDYVNFFNTNEFENRFLDKHYGVSFDGSDLSTSATLSANPIAEIIMIIGSHYGRNFK